MSRHILVDRPSLQVVLGYDHMLQAFFGQIFNPSHTHRAGIAVGGWPTRTGLGTRRPVRSYPEASEDLALLSKWASATLAARDLEHPEARAHLDALIRTLRSEWDDGVNRAEIPVPAVLRCAGTG